MLAVVSCGDAAIGNACKSHAECKSIPDGYCARAEVCTRVCSPTTPCPSGSACSFEERMVCLATCDVDANCSSGFTCQDRGGLRLCRLGSNPLAKPTL